MKSNENFQGFTRHSSIVPGPQRCFDEVGYTDLSGRLGVPLVDLNAAPTVENRASSSPSVRG